MLLEKPIAFESLNFLPGFPTISKFACNPFSTNFRAGACANPPIAVGRERTPLNGWSAVVAAIRAAGGTVPSYSGASMAGLGKEGAVARHLRHDRYISGLGERGSARHIHYEGNYPPASTSRQDHPGYQARLGGCECGGTCGGCSSGMGAFDASSILSWVAANWMCLAIGGGLIYFLKRR